MQVTQDDRLEQLLDRALKAHESHLSDIQLLEAELNQVRELYEASEELLQADVEMIDFSKARVSLISRTSLRRGDLHIQCNRQMDELRARIAQLEAKNKEYLDQMANHNDSEQRRELIRETKVARRSGQLDTAGDEVVNLLDETIDELMQKEKAIAYLKNELESKQAELSECLDLVESKQALLNQAEDSIQERNS